MKEVIGVGIIGASPERGWAGNAHIPALRALPQYRLAALSTTRAESARRAGEKFGVAATFDHHAALINHPEVDLVVVTVKVPYHFELVSAALEAGKSVYCEWPLGNGLAETEALAALAQRRGVGAWVGLQGRFSPVMRYVRHLIAEGYVGRVLSTSLIGSGMAWSGTSPQADAYVNDAANGATMLTIPLAHTLDSVCQALGEIASASAVMANQRTEFTMAETGATLPKSAEDQVVIAGRFASGAVLSLHYRGGRSPGTNFLWEINGTEGDLLLTGPGGHTQFMEPQLRGARRGAAQLEELPVPAEFAFGVDLPAGPARNVAALYRCLAEDMRTGTHRVATFDDAVHHHRRLDTLRRAADSGDSLVLS